EIAAGDAFRVECRPTLDDRLDGERDSELVFAERALNDDKILVGTGGHRCAGAAHHLQAEYSELTVPPRIGRCVEDRGRRRQVCGAHRVRSCAHATRTPGRDRQSDPGSWLPRRSLPASTFPPDLKPRPSRGVFSIAARERPTRRRVCPILWA